ncbi:MAG: ABC transporter ATP-binding protein, partial [Anaerolineae bacterium]
MSAVTQVSAKLHRKRDGHKKAGALPAWRVVLRLVRYRPWFYLGYLFFMSFIELLRQVPGLAMREFFDLLAGDARASLGIWAIVALLVATTVGDYVASYGINITMVPFYVHTTTLLRKNLFKQVLKPPNLQAQKAVSALPDSPGEAISRFRGDVFEVPRFAIWFSHVLAILFSGAVALVVMLHINAFITILALIPCALIGLVANVAARRIEKYRRASRKATGRVSGFIGELFGAVQAVKVATAEAGMLAHFRELGDERRQAALKERLFNETLNSFFRNAVNLGTGVIFILAAHAMQSGPDSAPAFTVGDLALFVYYLNHLSVLTAFSGELMALYKQLGVSVERLERLMAGAPPQALTEFSPIYMDGQFPDVIYPAKTRDHRLQTLSATGLTYHYPGSDKGIEDVNLRLERGTFTVITGRIGSGKTTLLRVLLGLLPAGKGQIRWNGAVVADPGAFFTPPRSAYTPQVPRLFSDSLQDNILLGLSADRETTMQALRLAVMEVDLGELEHGLETMIGPKGVKLSGGQVQRTAAARMFVREPELLVFDDLSSALD